MSQSYIYNIVVISSEPNPRPDTAFHWYNVRVNSDKEWKGKSLT